MRRPKVPPGPLERIRREHEQVQHGLERLAAKEKQELLASLRRAQLELHGSIGGWLRADADGTLSWNASRYREALARVNFLAGSLGEQVENRLSPAVREAQVRAVRDLQLQVASFDARALPNLDLLALVQRGQKFLIPRVRTSAARYAGHVRQDIKDRLLHQVALGRTVRETVNDLVRDGGPKGLVALKGVLGEEGAVAELIPEGLFVRYRWWAERVVRTEVGSAYNAQSLEAIDDLHRHDPDFGKAWIISPRACALCAPLDGATARPGELFRSSGFEVEAPPLHPNCLCTLCAWHPSWAQNREPRPAGP